MTRRKLAAILSADAEGYSRLMGANDALTVQTITRCRDIFSACVANRGGRVVKTPGDAVLAEFPSAVDAVQCAMEIQGELTTANARLPERHRMRFRIGVNLGDVIQKGADIYGDGVNIAARVEALAEGGSVCITGPVFEQVGKRLALGFEDLGWQTVKNIAEPVRVYRVRSRQDTPERRPDSGITPAVFNPPTPKPCIAVLPFDNFSGHREHDYFSLGFVDDLITDLSHFHNLQVISAYTSQKMDAMEQDELQEARRLDIGYLLRGNLRRRSDHIRISTQLLDTTTGSILWAERYDAPIDTLFDIQDEIVARVVGALSSQIDKSLLAAARKKPLTRMAAYDCWLQGMDQLRQGTPEQDEKARMIFKQALAIDSNYSRAYAGISLSYFNDWSCQLWDRWETTEKKAYEYAMRALRLDDTDHVVQYILGRIMLFRRQFDQAEQYIDRALSLNANDADILAQAASSYAWLGRAAEGEKPFRKAMRLNPYRNTWYYPYGALTHFVQQDYAAFLELALKGPLTDVWIDMPAYLAAAYALDGEPDEAARYLALFIKSFREEITADREPVASEMIDWLKLANPFRSDADTRHLLDGLRIAGLDGKEGTDRK